MFEKGGKTRPMCISKEEFDNNFDRFFNQKNKPQIDKEE